MVDPATKPEPGMAPSTKVVMDTSGASPTSTVSIGAKVEPTPSVTVSCTAYWPCSSYLRRRSELSAADIETGGAAVRVLQYRAESSRWHALLCGGKAVPKVPIQCQYVAVRVGGFARDAESERRLSSDGTGCNDGGPVRRAISAVAIVFDSHDRSVGAKNPQRAISAGRDPDRCTLGYRVKEVVGGTAATRWERQHAQLRSLKVCIKVSIEAAGEYAAREHVG